MTFIARGDFSIRWWSVTPRKGWVVVVSARAVKHALSIISAAADSASAGRID
jgi:hypothetical protein